MQKLTNFSRKNIVLIGDSAFAEIAYEYFTHDSLRKVVAFAVPKELRKKVSLFGLPVIDFENMEISYPPTFFDAHVAIAYGKLNRNREKMYNDTKAKGYHLSNYISSKAFVWHNVELGDNNFIFEGNVIQPFVKLGNNGVYWSGNHIGHHSSVGSNVFFSSHVVMSGFCEIGDNSFLGVNSTIGNNIRIGKNCVVGAGSLIMKHLPDNKQVKGVVSIPDEINTLEKYGI